jgi:hypothetical protein
MDRVTTGMEYEQPIYTAAEREENASQVREAVNHAGLSALLFVASSRLEELNVSFCSHNFDDCWWTQRRLRAIQSHKLLCSNLPLLRKLYLGGMAVKFGDLSAFLLRHNATLRSIEMSLLIIRDELLGSLLSLLTSEKLQLMELHLSDVYDRSSQHALFDGEPTQEFRRISGALHSRNNLHTWGKGTRQEVAYQYSNAAEDHKRTEAYLEWRNQCDGKFGRYRWVLP